MQLLKTEKARRGRQAFIIFEMLEVTSSSAAVEEEVEELGVFEEELDDESEVLDDGFDSVRELRSSYRLRVVFRRYERNR